MPRCINNVTPPAKPKPPSAKQIGFTPRKWDKLDAASDRGPFIYFYFTNLSLISTVMMMVNTLISTAIMMVQVSDFKFIIRTKAAPPIMRSSTPCCDNWPNPKEGCHVLSLRFPSSPSCQIYLDSRIQMLRRP